MAHSLLSYLNEKNIPFSNQDIFESAWKTKSVLEDVPTCLY